MAYFRYRNRNTNNRFNRMKFMQPFSFKRREKVEVNALPLNMIISEPASRDQAPLYSNLEEYLANSGSTLTKTNPVRQEVHADKLNNCPHNAQYGETKDTRCTPIDQNITFHYREDINCDLSSTCSEPWLNDRSLFSSDRSSVNLESDDDVCPKYPEKPRQVENDVLKNKNYKNYVPRVQPFLAVWSPKKKKSASLSQANYEATNVTDEYLDVQPFFQWSKQNLIGQKRRHEFQSTDPLYKVSKKEENRVELGKLSPNLNISPASDTNMEFAWKPRINTKEANEESADITFLYKSFTRLPYSSPTSSSFQFTPTIDEELKE